MNTRARILPLLALVAACRVLEPPGESTQPPDVVLRKVRIDQYRHGAASAEASLAELRYQRDAARADVDRLELKPLSGSQAGGKLTGKTARAELKKGLVHLAEGVNYAGADGSQLSTASCAIDLHDDEITGPDAVTLDQKGLHATADRFTGSYGDEPKVKLDGHVHATFAEEKPARAKPPKRRR